MGIPRKQYIGIFDVRITESSICSILDEIRRYPCCIESILDPCENIVSSSSLSRKECHSLSKRVRQSNTVIDGADIVILEIDIKYCTANTCDGTIFGKTELNTGIRIERTDNIGPGLPRFEKSYKLNTRVVIRYTHTIDSKS